MRRAWCINNNTLCGDVLMGASSSMMLDRVWFGLANPEGINRFVPLLLYCVQLLTYFLVCRSVLFCVCRAGAEIGGCDGRRVSVSYHRDISDPFEKPVQIFWLVYRESPSLII